MTPRFTQIATDIPGSEGPAFDRQGRFFCVAPDVGSILQLEDDGELREIANTGGVPAGLQLATDGSIWIADMKLGILKFDPQVSNIALTDVVRSFDGKPIRGCNDLSFDRRGNLYFTAPAGSTPETPVGEVYCRLINGDVRRLDAGFAFSNGIAVSADDNTLIVAETWTRKLWEYELVSPGVVRNKRLFATLPGDHNGGPDGIDFDQQGNLLATNWGGGAIEVFDADGKLIERIKTPFEKPSNLHLHPTRPELWITEHTHNSVWKCGFQR